VGMHCRECVSSNSMQFFSGCVTTINDGTQRKEALND